MHVHQHATTFIPRLDEVLWFKPQTLNYLHATTFIKSLDEVVFVELFVGLVLGLGISQYLGLDKVLFVGGLEAFIEEEG